MQKNILLVLVAASSAVTGVHRASTSRRHLPEHGPLIGSGEGGAEGVFGAAPPPAGCPQRRARPAGILLGAEREPPRPAAEIGEGPSRSAQVRADRRAVSCCR